MSEASNEKPVATKPKTRVGLPDDEDWSRRPVTAVPKPTPKRKPTRRGAK